MLQIMTRPVSPPDGVGVEWRVGVVEAVLACSIHLFALLYTPLISTKDEKCQTENQKYGILKA